MKLDDKSDAYLDALVAAAVKKVDRAQAEREAQADVAAWERRQATVEPVTEQLSRAGAGRGQAAAKLFSGTQVKAGASRVTNASNAGTK